jgi:hypothetical protein
MDNSLYIRSIIVLSSGRLAIVEASEEHCFLCPAMIDLYLFSTIRALHDDANCAVYPNFRDSMDVLERNNQQNFFTIVDGCT